ncbi:CH-like domain in sperm protein [Plasmodiophora brassicae]
MEQAAADFINGAGVSRRVQADRLARDLSDGVLVGEILAGRGALDLARLDANAESLHSKLNNWQILAGT